MSDPEEANNWNLSPEKARALQAALSKKVQIEPLHTSVSTIAGADISFNKYESTVYTGFIVLDIKTLKPLAHSLAISETSFPYIPGLLSFREIPSLLQAWELLQIKPDVVMMDGHGIAHPRRLGIATHFGLITDWPSFGVAKKKLFGSYTEPEPAPQSYTVLSHGQHTLGYVYRSKKNVKPVFISPGHKTSLEDALMISSLCITRYRIPEPTRQAHLLVNQLRRREIAPGFQTYTEK